MREIENKHCVVKLGIYRDKPDADKTKEILESYPPVANVPNMAVPNTGQDVWDNLDKGAQITDLGIQRSQGMQAAALSAILRIIHAIGNGTAGVTEDHLQGLTDATRMITSSFSSLNQVRKDNIRNCMGWPIARLCDWKTPVGTSTIFPELNKKLTENDSARSKLNRRNKYK